MSHGYICKKCHGPAPYGVGYIDNTPGALEASTGRDECPCGASKKPVMDLMSRYALRNVTNGQADVYDVGQWQHRGTVYRITGQPLDLAPINGKWGVIYPDGTSAGEHQYTAARSEARDLVESIAINALGATTLTFRTRAYAARFALLTY